MGPQNDELALGIMGLRPRCPGCNWASIRLFRFALILGIMTIGLASCATTGVDSGLYVVRMPDGEPKWIGQSAGIPVWSPRQDLIAWGNEDGLFLAADKSVRRLADASVVGTPAWSPDGDEIAFLDRQQSQLVVINAETGLVQFTEPIEGYGAQAPRGLPVLLGGPTWAPDGTRLAFVCFDGSGDEICVIDANGTGRRQVTQLEPLEIPRTSSNPVFAPAGSNSGPAAWSPDGASVAVATYPERPESPAGVFVVDVRRARARRVSDLLPNSVIGWFPGGRSVYFSAPRPDESDMSVVRNDVYQVYIRAAAERNITDGLQGGARNPALSPDGNRMAMESAGIIIILSERSFPREYSVPGLSATHPAWSHDGSSLAFVAKPDPITIYD